MIEILYDVMNVVDMTETEMFSFVRVQLRHHGSKYSPFDDNSPSLQTACEQKVMIQQLNVTVPPLNLLVDPLNVMVPPF